MAAFATAAIVSLYLGLILFVGWWKGRRENTLESYLVGDRRVPWWAVLGSLVATEVSAATFLAVPAVGFSEHFGYLQFGVGSFAARIFVATVFIQLFYRSGCLSIYEYLGQRFGGSTQLTASLYFLLTRLLASGVRLMIAVTGIAVVTGWPFANCLLLFGVLTLVYTSFGGIKAVIWTDCIQAVVFISAGIGALWWLTAEIGTAPLLESAAASGHLQLWQWKPQDSAWWNDGNWLVTAVLFGFISTVAAFSTDQDMVQRLLASRSSGMARRSLILSGFVALPVAALFLALGVALFVWFQLHPDAAFPLREVNGAMLPDADKVMAFFMTTPIPGWLRGLLLAGLLAAAMSSLDSAMAAMSASATRDIIAPLQRVQWSAQQWLLSSRLLTAAFAAALMFIAWILRDAAGFLWLAFKITSLTYGSLLGVFLLGRFSQRGTDRGNVRAMLIATALTSSALWLIETGRLPVAWTWLLVFGTVVTFSLAWLSGAKSTTYRIN